MAGRDTGSPVSSSVTRSPARSGILDEPLEVGDAGLGLEQWFLVLVAQEPDELAHLGQRAARGFLDRLERLVRASGIATQELAGGVRLDGDEADRVADDVVQLARDPAPFGTHGFARSLFPFGCELHRELLQFRRARAFSPERLTGEPGHEREDDESECEVAGAVAGRAERVDEVRHHQRRERGYGPALSCMGARGVGGDDRAGKRDHGAVPAGDQIVDDDRARDDRCCRERRPPPPGKRQGQRGGACNAERCRAAAHQRPRDDEHLHQCEERQREQHVRARQTREGAAGFHSASVIASGTSRRPPPGGLRSASRRTLNQLCGR